MNELRSSPTLRSIVIYGATGAGFAGANLLLARGLPAAQYGLFTLALALINLAYAAGTAGLDALVTRRGLPAGPLLLRRVLLSGSMVALGFTVAGRALYGIGWSLLALVLVASVGGAAMSVAGARFQSEQRFTLSLALTQSPNLVLLLAAGVELAVGSGSAGLPLLIATAGYAGSAVLGWWLLAREATFGGEDPRQIHWAEALALAALDASGLLLVQLDRLVIPHLLSLTDLATFGVLAAIVGSLFRVLQMGVGYTLIPRLRAAATVEARRRLIRDEAGLVTGIVVVGAAAIWVITPVLERWLLQGKYDLTSALVLAAILAGVAKVLNAFAKSLVTALADRRELGAVTLAGWLGVLVGVAAAVLGARWGLVGVIYGVGLGWLVRALAALRISARHLRLSSPPPAPTP